MSKVEEIYQEAITLSPDDRRRLIEMLSQAEGPEAALDPIDEYIYGWGQVYEGLSEDEIDEIESEILTHRVNFERELQI